MERSTIKMNSNKLLLFMIYILLSGISIIITELIKNLPFKEWTQWFSFTILTLLIGQIIVLQNYKCKISVFTLISLFSFLFQFGATICYAVGFEQNLWDLRIGYYSSQPNYIRGNMIALMCIVGFTLGGLFVKLFDDNNSYYVENKLTEECGGLVKYYRFLGYGLIIISLPFFMFTFFYSFKTIISGGSYTVLAEQRLPGYITSLGKFVYVGLMVLVYYYHKKGKKGVSLTYCVIIFAFLGLQMVSGARSEPMTILFAFLIFYFTCIRVKLKRKTVIGLVILVYILASLLYAIQISRQAGFNISDIVKRFFTSGFNVLLYEFSEFGGSALTTAVVTGRIQEFHPSWFFIKEILSLSPISINSPYAVVASVAAGSPELGTTFVGEMYYYFGMFCPVASFLIAVYITVIEKKICRLVNKGNYIVFFMCIMWMWQEINCIRASYNLAIKTFIYSYVLFTFVRMIYTTINGNRIGSPIRNN